MITVILTGLGALSSLGTACVGQSPLPASQIYSYAVGAGFPPAVAVQMTAIALRESGGCADGHYQGRTGTEEDSYGLWQINTKANPQILTQLGVTDPTALYDPALAARAAYLIYGGNPDNLNAAWYIDRPGVYQDGYLKYLPAAEQGALQAGADPQVVAGMEEETGTGGEGTDSGGGGGVDWMALLGVAAVGVLGLVLVRR